MNYVELGELLDKGVKGIASLESNQRTSWVSYFFEILEAEMDESILHEAKAMLEERFSAGRW